jgi:Flp pilus assembly pilin Flp
MATKTVLIPAVIPQLITHSATTLFRAIQGIGLAAASVILMLPLMPAIRASHIFLPHRFWFLDGTWQVTFIGAGIIWSCLYRLTTTRKFYDHVGRLLTEESGQDIAEYAVMLAVILVVVIGTVKMIGSNANNVFVQVSSSIDTK